MALNINSRPDRNFCIVTISGHLTLGPDLRRFQDNARSALETGNLDGMILDVSGIRYTDSAGLGELTIIYTLCTRKNCALILVSVPSQLQQMLELTRLDALLPSAPDIDTAKRQVKLLAHKARGAAGE